MSTDNKLADALRDIVTMLRDNPKMQSREYIGLGIAANNALREYDAALAEHDAKGDYDYALPIAEPIPISPDDLWTCPLPEHWRRAIEERGIENPKALDWIEQRARELAQEENYG